MIYRIVKRQRGSEERYRVQRKRLFFWQTYSRHEWLDDHMGFRTYYGSPFEYESLAAAQKAVCEWSDESRPRVRSDWFTVWVGRTHT